LIVNGQSATDNAEQIKIDLSRHTFALLNLQGNVMSVRFDPVVGGLSQSFVRTLLAITQFVAPGKQATGLERWETRESDPSGEYVAHYEAMAESPARSTDVGIPSQKSFSKIKTRYIQAPPEAPSDEVKASSEISPKGSMVATFDFQLGYLVSLNGMESQTTLIEGRTVATAKNSLRMAEVRQETVGPEELAAIRELSTGRERIASAIPLFAPPSQEANEASIQRAELGDATLESLLSTLAQLDSATGNTNETPLYLKFKAMIYLHPESCAGLGRILTTADAAGATMRILAGALSAVNHAEAQAALVTAVDRVRSWRARPATPTSGTITFTDRRFRRATLGTSSQFAKPDIASTAQLVCTWPATFAQIARTLAKIVAGLSTPSSHRL
jgi:hypothetical protein